MRIVKYRNQYAVYYRHDGLPKRHSLGTSDRDLADRRFEEFKSSLERQRVSQGFTIAELWERRRGALAGRRTAESMSYTGRLILPFWGHRRPSEITEDLCNDYTSARSRLGRKPGTILTELNHLRSTLTWAASRGLIERAPRVFMPGRPDPRCDFLTKDQARALLDHCRNDHTRLFIQLALATGGRSSAILELTWDRVHFDRRLIQFSIPGQRYHKGRPEVPMNDQLFEIMRTAKTKSTGHPNVITWADAPLRSIKKAIRSTAVSAGLPFVTPHVFRHSAAVWMAEAGVPMEEIAQFLGHTDPKITRRVYARFSPDYLQNAARALEL